MTKTEATEMANRLNITGEVFARVVRILPKAIDPPKPNDNGWDVLVTDLSYNPND